MRNGCPLCNEKNHTIIYDGERQKAALVKCTNCSHIYTLLKQELQTDKLYSDEVYRVVENRKSIFDKILNWEYERVLNKLSHFKPAGGSLLDFGCGKGKFSSLAKDKGWQV